VAYLRLSILAAPTRSAIRDVCVPTTVVSHAPGFRSKKWAPRRSHSARWQVGAPEDGVAGRHQDFLAFQRDAAPAQMESELAWIDTHADKGAAHIQRSKVRLVAGPIPCRGLRPWDRPIEHQSGAARRRHGDFGCAEIAPQPGQAPPTSLLYPSRWRLGEVNESALLTERTGHFTVQKLAVDTGKAHTTIPVENRRVCASPYGQNELLCSWKICQFPGPNPKGSWIVKILWAESNE